MELVPLHHRVDARLFHAGPIGLIHYFGPPSPAAVSGDFDCTRQLVEQFGEVSYLVLLEAHLVGRPSRHALAVVNERLADLGARCRGSAVVVRGTGIAPSMMRLAITGAAFVGGNSATRKVFSTVREGLLWLQSLQVLPEGRAVKVEAVEAALRLEGQP